MSPLSLIITTTLAHFLAVISPGPDFVVAVRNSLQYSRKTGVWTALGFALGILVHVTYCIAGFAILIAQSEVLFNSVKIAGGLYLLYMGFQSFRAGKLKTSFETTVKEDILWYQALKMGFITNVLNPKATLFFLSLFTVIIRPETPKWVTIVVASFMILNTFLWFAFVAFLFTQKSIRNAYLRQQNVIHKTMGVVLFGLGLVVIFL